MVAEDLVEEWLNRRGFFTIRGAKVGNKEMHILALRPGPGEVELWHYEVTGSLRPMSYIAPLPREVQRATGRRSKNAARRSPELVEQGVAEWVQNKYNDESLQELRNNLCRGRWQFAFVYAKAVHGDEELPLIERARIQVIKLAKIIDHLRQASRMEESKLSGAAGSDLSDLVMWEHLVGPLRDSAGSRPPHRHSPIGG